MHFQKTHSSQKFLANSPRKTHKGKTSQRESIFISSVKCNSKYSISTTYLYCIKCTQTFSISVPNCLLDFSIELSLENHAKTVLDFCAHDLEICAEIRPQYLCKRYSPYKLYKPQKMCLSMASILCIVRPRKLYQPSRDLCPKLPRNSCLVCTVRIHLDFCAVCTAV